MREKDLKRILQQPYSFDYWKELLPMFFKKVQYFSQAQALFEEHEKVVQGKQIGRITLDDEKSLAIFEVEITDNVVIARNRKELRDIAIKHIDQDITHGAIVFFHSPNQKDYRFSFIAKWSALDMETGEFIKGETKPKRYTYLLGPNEACTTAAKRLLTLIPKKEAGKATIKELQQVFSVEALNREFFKSYKIHYEKFWKYLAESPWRDELIDAEKEEPEKKEKPIRDFVKKLLGRIVFLHFLQKKGWMGCSSQSNEWMDGEKRFMQLLFEEFTGKENFHSQCLTKLFFETLNTKRPKGEFHIDGLEGRLNGSHVPYLNGGLFEPEKNKATLKVDFPRSYFEELLEFFEQYNFTIDENSPDDHEVGIDPEMLGHIFENLLEENREKGAFYTPKEIVQYMCQESLIQYLYNHFGKRQDIDDFIRQHTVSAFLAERDNASQVNQLLDDIKVCDPAIGSGAFPIGMLQEIFDAKRFIYPYLKTNQPFDPAATKKSIIQNSIYGVDIEKGAVDIAQLRFWLALVVEEVNPHPLPNLDYKIMQGNSLLEQYEGIDLSQIALPKGEKIYEPERDLFGNIKEDQMKITFAKSDTSKKIKALINEFFTIEDAERKKEIRQQINALVEDHIQFNIHLREQQLNRFIAEAGNPANLNKNARKKFDGFVSDLEKIQETKANLLKIQETDERPYFLWHLYFMDVFERGGFDVMIGNPPYIQLQKMNKTERDRLSQSHFKTFSGTSDIYCLFYEKGFELLVDDGTLCYITSNTWMRTNFGATLRNIFSSVSNPVKLLNFEDTQIFPAATVEANILLAKNKEFSGELEAVAVKSDFNIKQSIQDYFTENRIMLDSLSDEGWIILEPMDFSILNRIKEAGVTLKNWDVEFYRGMLTGFNEAFYIDGQKRKELIQQDPNNENIIKRLIRGREIRRWRYEFNDNYAIYPHNGVRENRQKGTEAIPRINVERDYPIIYDHLLKYKDKDSPLAVQKPDGTYQTLIDRTDQGDHWTNLRNCAYIMQLEDEKLVWLAITDRPAFAYDNKSTYVSNPSYFMSGKHLKYLLGCLNSRVIQWYMDKITSSTGQGTNQWNKMYIELLPIPLPNNLSLETKVETLSEYLTFINSSEVSEVFENISEESITELLENVLDMMVYELYFEEEMKSKKLDVLQFINEKTFPDISEMNPEEKKASIQKVYYELQQKDNPIRNRILVSESRSEIIRRINEVTGS
ncbi:hypothetical protein D1013_16285 [Euzebyella marina]|uniref:site-specific DNA-methyltransferase (adenine-specific) n=1 Tax=Euzebyella marina TaxID=1761453 RepID=A0A3G2L998_9FLAO|nr:TaqI-like C-terminal specificity domain-containing protein [Euzebyella marina]AYN68827.1 hypothetical protein D1013_16285 [Euzebyella marina]